MTMSFHVTFKSSWIITLKQLSLLAVDTIIIIELNLSLRVFEGYKRAEPAIWLNYDLGKG